MICGYMYYIAIFGPGAYPFFGHRRDLAASRDLTAGNDEMANLRQRRSPYTVSHESNLPPTIPRGEPNNDLRADRVIKRYGEGEKRALDKPELTTDVIHDAAVATV
jgi:hypothetical protein